MAYDVRVHIDLKKPIGTVGFGVPLILLENAAEAVNFTKVSNIAEVVSAGFEASSIVYKAAQLMFAQKHAPKYIAVCAVTGTAVEALADEAMIAKDWRQLIVVNNGDAAASTVTSIAAAVESLDGKLYFAGLETDDEATVAVTGLRRTVLFYCDTTDAVPVPVAAFVGESAGCTVGSLTYKNMPLIGVEAQELTSAEIDAIHEKGGITVLAKSGDVVTSDGKLAGGEWIDVMDCEDYIIQQLTYRTQKLLNNMSKVPFDNNGIALLETVAIDVMQGAYNNGMIATNADGAPDYSVSYALREDTSEEDRSNRRYLGGSFTFALAGAIHEVEITGTITA